jgi:hypothetical protein
LGIKINSVEFQQNGFSADEAANLVELLERHQFDLVELSGGTYEDGTWGRWQKRDSTVQREAFFLEFADRIAPRLYKTKSFVTGGLRSAKAMVAALKTVDGVGLGRSACSEPRLPADILGGGLKGAVIPLLDELDFGITSILAGGQMRQISQNLEPLDPSDPKAIDGFNKDVEQWRAELLAEDTTTEPRNIGAFEMKSVPSTPYKTPTKKDTARS